MITIRLRAKEDIIPLSFAEISAIDFVCFLEPFRKFVALPLANIFKKLSTDLELRVGYLIEIYHISEKPELLNIPSVQKSFASPNNPPLLQMNPGRQSLSSSQSPSPSPHWPWHLFLNILLSLAAYTSLNIFMKILLYEFGYIIFIHLTIWSSYKTRTFCTSSKEKQQRQ